LSLILISAYSSLIKNTYTFSKNYKNQQQFFSCKKYSFLEEHFERKEDQKIFLSREKIFSLPIFLIFPLYQKKFSLYR